MTLRQPLLAAALATLVAAPLLLIGLGHVPFDDPGEGMHAQIARELRGGGDPFALRLNGVPYVDKPPLLYTLVAATFALAGESEAAARAVSALAALVAIAATAALAGHLLGVGGGLVAGSALLTSVGFFVYSRYLRPETLFIAAVGLGFAFMLTGVVRERRSLVTVGLACFGLASLAKDPLGALIPPLVVGLALALAGRARPFGAWLPWPGVIAWLVLGFGWWVLAEMRTPGFTWYTVVDNHLLNIVRARQFPDEDAPIGPVTFLIVSAIGASPWIVAAAFTVVRLVRSRAWRDPDEVPWTTLTLWSAGVLVAVTLSPFRLPHYGLPAYPAIALLAARAWSDSRSRTLLTAHAATLVAAAAACVIAWRGGTAAVADSVMTATDVATVKATAVGYALAPPPWEEIVPLFSSTAVLAAVGALGLGMLAVGRRTGRWSGAAIVLATMIAVMPAVASGLSSFSAHRTVRALAQELARHVEAADLVVHEGPIENSGALEWYSGRRPVIVDGRHSVLSFGATLNGDTFWEPSRLGAAWRSDRRVWIITTRAPEASVVTTLPGARLVARDGGRRLYVNR